MTSSSHTIDDTLALLDTERAALLASVDRVATHDRDRRPGTDRWSVAEVLEHLATVERGIVKLITLRGRDQPTAETEAAQPLDEGRISHLRSRTERRTAPERVKPSGTVSAEDALRTLGETRASLRDAAVAADPASLDACTHKHPVLGTLTLRDWIHFVAHHEARHCEQIGEIADSLEAAKQG